MGLKVLLAVLACFHFIAWVFVITATAVTDWAKSDLFEYGIWRYCLPDNNDNCANWVLTGSTAGAHIKDCEGALTTTRAFSVISIIWIFFCLALALALMAKTSLIKKSTVMLNMCLVALAALWCFIGWIMFLGVEARGMCAFNDYGTHLGSSWFLQLFGWIVELLACLPLTVIIFMKWKKIPRYLGQPPFVPGPVPYGPPAASYPQYKSPYPSGPVPYAGGAGSAYKAPYAPAAGAPPAPYAGVYGPTPNTSPYVPTPYW